MKVKDMIERLLKLDGDLEIAILDGFNGGGEPRTINFGPSVKDPTIPHQRYNYDDLESNPEQKIVVMGYGCY